MNQHLREILQEIEIQFYEIKKATISGHPILFCDPTKFSTQNQLCMLIYQPIELIGPSLCFSAFEIKQSTSFSGKFASVEVQSPQYISKQISVTSITVQV